jgi:hypothetical protein
MSSDEESSVGSSSIKSAKLKKTKSRKGAWGVNTSIGKNVVILLITSPKAEDLL